MERQSSRSNEGGTETHATSEGAARVSASDRLVELATQRYELGRGSDGEPFAVERIGPNVARMFRGGRISLRANLARIYADEYDKVPPGQSLVDALSPVGGPLSNSAPISARRSGSRRGSA